ncbi:hypothetical protein BDV95DRAFT_612704 [Massariosphaeria phaeospora]|uniref:Uncharacterized protein n=1 Tax=Massariosphaeria phaeospora TaxID=100035 RepID=A0A7C8HYS2_9PLEO|nr:hypothetical protein BDV95DRAFT_612704 [Massariosphaeria phaeospora]
MTFENFLQTYSIDGMAHLNVPLPDSSIMKFEIMRERNAAVTAAVRNRSQGRRISTYYVSHITLDLALGQPTRSQVLLHLDDYLPVVHAATHGTFLTKLAAESSARELLEDWKAGVLGSRIQFNSQGDDTLVGALLERTSTGFRKSKILHVHHDDEMAMMADGSTLMMDSGLE